jgi:predicted transcriptional regulator
LRTDFPYDDQNGLLTAIGFGDHAKARSEAYQARNATARVMGFASAEEAELLAKLVSETGVTTGELRALIAQRQGASQPEESVLNPERRRKGVLERRDNAPTKESVTRERTIQPGAGPETLEAKAYLRTKYKNTQGQLICQCCHAEMPFKVRDIHYFEAIQCVRGLGHHYFENRLALCPTCAAMYLHARDSEDAEIRRSIVDHAASAVEIIIKLAGREFQLRFVGTHWFDLRTVLQGP